MHLSNPTQIFPNTCELTVLEFNVVDFRAAEHAHNSLLFQFKRKYFCLHVKLWLVQGEPHHSHLNQVYNPPRLPPSLSRTGFSIIMQDSLAISVLYKQFPPCSNTKWTSDIRNTSLSRSFPRLNGSIDLNAGCWRQALRASGGWWKG